MISDFQITPIQVVINLQKKNYSHTVGSMRFFLKEACKNKNLLDAKFTDFKLF